MATILAFPEMQAAERREPARRDTPTLQGPPRPAEIILFPGVRYERWSDAPADRGSTRDVIVRDRLQLIE